MMNQKSLLFNFKRLFYWSIFLNISKHTFIKYWLSILIFLKQARDKNPFFLLHYTMVTPRMSVGFWLTKVVACNPVRWFWYSDGGTLYNLVLRSRYICTSAVASHRSYVQQVNIIRAQLQNYVSHSHTQPWHLSHITCCNSHILCTRLVRVFCFCIFAYYIFRWVHLKYAFSRHHILSTYTAQSFHCV